MKGECAMKQPASNELNAMRIPSLSHAPMAPRRTSIATLPSAPVPFAFAGYSSAQAGASAATCTVISKRRTMNWVGRPLGSCGSSG